MSGAKKIDRHLLQMRLRATVQDAIVVAVFRPEQWVTARTTPLEREALTTQLERGMLSIPRLKVYARTDAWSFVGLVPGTYDQVIAEVWPQRLRGRGRPSWRVALSPPWPNGLVAAEQIQIAGAAQAWLFPTRFLFLRDTATGWTTSYAGDREEAHATTVSAR